MTELDLMTQACAYLAGTCPRPEFEDHLMRTVVMRGSVGWWDDIESAVYEGLSDEGLKAVVRRCLDEAPIEVRHRV